MSDSGLESVATGLRVNVTRSSGWCALLSRSRLHLRVPWPTHSGTRRFVEKAVARPVQFMLERTRCIA